MTHILQSFQSIKMNIFLVVFRHLSDLIDIPNNLFSLWIYIYILSQHNTSKISVWLDKTWSDAFWDLILRQSGVRDWLERFPGGESSRSTFQKYVYRIHKHIQVKKHKCGSFAIRNGAPYVPECFLSGALAIFRCFSDEISLSCSQSKIARALFKNSMPRKLFRTKCSFVYSHCCFRELSSQSRKIPNKRKLRGPEANGWNATIQWTGCSF